MEKALFADIGNTNIKWQIGEIAQPTIAINELHNYSETINLFNNSEQIYISCNNKEPQKTVKPFLSSSAIYWINKTPNQETINLSSYDKNALGVDRFFAMFAVQHLVPLTIVDCGTAITVDQINKKKEHQGGWILPSIEICKNYFKQQFGFHAKESMKANISLGNNTQSAIQNGYYKLIVTLLNEMSRTTKQTASQEKFIITGNGALPILQKLSKNWNYQENLVLKGLYKFIKNKGASNE